jgi:hypothetical protein
MKRTTRSLLAVTTVLGSLAVAVGAQAGGPADEVLLCHGTASATNPYVLISVSANALQGHLDGTEPGHGWRNADDVLLLDYATCEEAAAGEGDPGPE